MYGRFWIHRAFGLLLILTTSCVLPLSRIEPNETLWQRQDTGWETVAHRRVIDAERIPHSSFFLEHASPRACLFVVSEVGISGEHLFTNRMGSVGRTLWRQGYSVISTSVPESSLNLQDWREDALMHFLKLLDSSRDLCGELPMIGIGHGIAGSLLLERAMNQRLHSLVLLSVPLTYSGMSVAAARALGSANDWAWRDLAGIRVPANFSGTTTLEEVLMTNQDNRKDRFELYQAEGMRLPFSFRKTLLDERRPITDLALSPSVQTWLYDTQPALVVLASGNGWVSTWQADPIAMGAPASRTDRIYVTRANGSAREFNHFDLFWDDESISQVWRPIIRWLRQGGH